MPNLNIEISEELLRKIGHAALDGGESRKALVIRVLEKELGGGNGKRELVKQAKAEADPKPETRAVKESWKKCSLCDGKLIEWGPGLRCESCKRNWAK